MTRSFDWTLAAEGDPLVVIAAVSLWERQPFLRGCLQPFAKPLPLPLSPNVHSSFSTARPIPRFAWMEHSAQAVFDLVNAVFLRGLLKPAARSNWRPCHVRSQARSSPYDNHFKRLLHPANTQLPSAILPAALNSEHHWLGLSFQSEVRHLPCRNKLCMLCAHGGAPSQCTMRASFKGTRLSRLSALPARAAHTTSGRAKLIGAMCELAIIFWSCISTRPLHFVAL